MNGKTWKVLALVMTMILSCMITACNSNDKADKALKSLDLVDNKDLKPVTLKFYFPGTEKANTRDVLKEIEKYTYDQMKVKLDFEWLPELISGVGYEAEITKKLAAGEDFDGFYMYDYKYSTNFNFSGLVKSGWIKDISSSIRKYAPSIYGKLSNEQLKSASFNGGIYAVPSLYPKAKALYALVREDLIRKYKIPEIKTYDDYETFLKTIKQKETSITVPAEINNRETSMRLFAGALGYTVLDDKLQLVYKNNTQNAKITAWEKTPEFSQAAKKLINWYQNGCVEWVGEETTDHPVDPVIADLKIRSDLLSGDTASTLIYGNSSYAFNSQLKSGWEFKDYLLYPDNEYQTESPLNGCIMFSKKSKNVERAMMFLDWLQSDQKRYNLMMYGREGKEYSLDGDNYVLPEGTESEDTSTYLGWQGRDAFKNVSYERYIEGTPDDFKEQYMKFINNNTIYPFHNGYYPDFTNLYEFNRIDQLSLIVDSHLRSGVAPGQGIDPDLIDQYNTYTKNMVETLQLQFDKWKGELKQNSK